jgi:2-C-methyl-D-erythritol 4-phosphate cytidylyltransferase
MLTAIIVAAGSSSRMGFDKMLAPLAGKSVIEYAVDAFEGADSVSAILVVTRNDRRGDFEKQLQGRTKVREVVAGGEHRQDSVRAGLRRLSADARYVAVHDGARALITSSQIESVFARACEQGAAAMAEPVIDTLKRGDQSLYVTGSIDRQQVYAMQTPQIFARDILEEAYQAVAADKVQITDEVSAVEYLGRKVALVPPDDFNFKITYERDLRLAALILRERAQRG